MHDRGTAGEEVCEAPLCVSDARAALSLQRENPVHDAHSQSQDVDPFDVPGPAGEGGNSVEQSRSGRQQLEALLGYFEVRRKVFCNPGHECLSAAEGDRRVGERAAELGLL